MADAACGPSNALQQFKQQTQHDRTLQQDRLTNRQHPAQGFRSVDPNAGLLDPEFEAFQAGLPPPAFQSFQSHRPTPQPFQQPFQEPAQAPSSWANDFQRMNLSSPPPMQQQQTFAPNTSNWAQDFRSNVAQNAPRAQNSSPSPFAFQQRARYGMGGYQSNFAQPAFSPAMQSKGKEPVTEQFDEAAFERAFDMAKEDMMESTPEHALDNAQVGQETEMLSAEKSEESHQLNKDDIQEKIHESNQPLDIDQQIMPEGIIREQPKEQQDSTSNDDDALAATAQELLEKVENNQSEKFRNSQFLGLMRKLRDREVKVEGDKMVETTTTASTSTADLPLNTTSVPRFNNSEQIPREEQDLDAHRHAHDPASDGSDVVNLLQQPGLPGGSPSDPASLAPDTDASGIDMSEDMERRRLGDLWRSMLPSESSPRGLDPRTHSAGAEESGFASPAFTA